MPLDPTLARIPGLGGALAMRDYRRQQAEDQLGQVTQAAKLEDYFRQQDEMQKVRTLLQTEKDPEKLIPALAAIGPTGGQYAKQYADALNAAEGLKLTKQFTGGGDVNNLPADKLEALGNALAARGHPGGASLVNLAERKRKLASDQATFNTMKGTPDQIIPPDQQQVEGAFDVGAIPPQPQTVKGDPTTGLFGTLMKSEIPQVAQQAKVLQARLEASDPRSVPPQYWENQQARLASQEASMLQAKARMDIQQGSPETIENTAKQIANYQLAPLQGFVMKTPWGQQVMSRVAQLNPDYRATEFTGRSRAVSAFKTGKQGDQVRSFNVGLAHLDTLSDLADALGNSDVKAINRLSQFVSDQTGAAAPKNFDAAKEIVANEIVKAIVGAGGGVTDRQKAQDEVSRANSPEQLKGVIETYKQLFGGQLAGLKRQYETSTGLKNFEDDLLSPEGRVVARKYAPRDEQPAAAPGETNPAKPIKAMTNAELAARRAELMKKKNGGGR